MKHFPSWIPTLRRGILFLAAAGTLVAAACMEENLRGERAYRRFEAACRADGKPLDYAFYRPVPVEDDQNLFRAPVLAQFFNPTDDTGAAAAAFERDKPLPADLAKLVGQRWQHGQATDLAAAYALLKKAPQSDPRAAALLVLDSLQRVRPELDAVRDAARTRPCSQVAFREDGYLAPTFKVLRYFTPALTLRAVAELELGRNDDAFADTYAAMRLVEGAVNFPSHLHLLMANVSGTLSLQAFWEGCARGAWSGAQLAAMQALLTRLHPLRELPAALAAGRAASALYYASVPRPRWMPEGWWKLNIVEFFQPRFGGWDPLSFDPVAERIDLRAIGEADAHFERLQHTHSPFLWLARHNAWPHQIIAFIGSAQNAFTLARTACALERYRIRGGGYPASLAALVPSLMPEVPRDVIDGQPLRYACADGAHFRLYSIGLNGVDDQGALPGKAGASGTAAFPWMSPGGDWAWPQGPAQ